jgi:eukaryotic-like serine/threonine-protein kinase
LKPALVAIGAVLLVGGGGLAGYGLTRKPTGGIAPQASEAMTSAASQLDGDIKAARASAQERARSLAGIQQVQSAVATDKATAEDQLQRGELKFDMQKGEVIELGQVPNGGKAIALLVQPQGGMASPHAGTPGSFADMMDDHLVIVEVASVTPKANADQLTGYVSVSRPLDLKPAIDRLSAAGVTGTIQIGSQTRPIGTLAPGAATKDMPLSSLKDAKLVVAAPAVAGAKPMPLIAGGGATAALGLLLLILGLVSKGASAAPTAAAGGPAPSVRPTPTTGFGNAQTQLSASTAAGTPSPVDAGGSYISPSSLGPGAMIGRWEIIKRLGSGGMADVFLARSKGEAGFEKTVAIKVMHPHLARNSRAVDHFLDEARLASTIHHPNVIAIQDLGKIGEDFVIVMEYVDGVDLERVLASARNGQRPVPIEIGMAIMCRICDGLNAAHTAVAKDGTPLSIIHRDVKSANVLLSKQGGVKVVDFGIAKAAQQGHNTVAGETKGTPSMMAPEQRVGEQVDVRADVYSVAAVGFEVLTGHGVNLDLAALAHLGVENWPHLPLPSSLRPQLPPELDALLLGAMAFERDKRPANCLVFEEMFEAVMKKYGMSVSDKDIARWVTMELTLLAPGEGGAATLSPPVQG